MCDMMIVIIMRVFILIVVWFRFLRVLCWLFVFIMWFSVSRMIVVSFM